MKRPPSGQSITTFRGDVNAALAAERDGDRRDIVILAIDGIPLDLAATSWTTASISVRQSVFPTTSSTAWLSSLTGATVAEHGVPGVVFRIGEALINVFEYGGSLGEIADGNIFSDARAAGYRPVSVVGDWEPYDCAWRSALLRHSELVFGYRFFTLPVPPSPTALCAQIRAALAACRCGGSGDPLLVWCFVDADRHVHRHGYDEQLLMFLAGIGEVATDLAERGLHVLVHSDHGLTRTNNNREVEQLMEAARTDLGCALGGAGRTRWIYTAAGTYSKVATFLERNLPSSIRLYPADACFQSGTIARARVGELVLVAEGEDFLAFPGHRFDHGSSTAVELQVAVAEWCRS